MFVKYVERLKKIHTDLNNHSEAAQVLLMHASYPWTEDKDVPQFVVDVSGDMAKRRVLKIEKFESFEKLLTCLLSARIGKSV